MVPEFVWPPRQQPAVGPADRQPVGAGSACRLPKGPGELAIAPLGPLGSPYPSKRGPVVQFLDGYVPVRPVFGGRKETK